MTKYFLKVVLEKETLRVYPVPGCGLDVKKRVSCPRELRSKDGDILVADSVKIASTGKYYVSTGVRAVMHGTDDERDYIALTTPKATAKPDSTTTSLPHTDTFLDKINKDTTLVSPKSDKDGYYISSTDWAILVRNIKKHINTMIIGPTGSGKTSCIKEVCERMGVKLHIFDMGSMIDPISSLLGVHRLEKGESVFDYAKFTQVIQEPCVILLDELNRASLACNNVLFPCLDDRRSLSIEIASGKGMRDIKVHPEVTFIATANVGQEYTGTNSMDRALVNRFFPIELGYLPGAEEVKVIVNRTKINKDSAEIIVKVANNIRSLYKKQEVSTSISVRETLMVGNLVSDGWNLAQAMEIIYLPLYEGTKDEGERGTIYKTISSY